LIKAIDLGLKEEIEYVPDTHVASKNRHVYLNGRLNLLSKLFLENIF
jgi:hypothetical protein